MPSPSIGRAFANDDEPEGSMAIVLPQCTFLHNPKCGGTWVISALTAAGIPFRIEPEGFPHEVAATEGRFVFTFVRHPLTWYASFWNYRWKCAVEQQAEPFEVYLQQAAKRREMPIDDCLVNERGVPVSFPAFIEHCLARHSRFVSRCHSEFTDKAHFVGRFESLVDDLLLALGEAGVTFDPDIIRRTPKVNVSSPRFRTEYPYRLADRVVADESAFIQEYYGASSQPALTRVRQRSLQEAC
jgi:hypothetical protein